MEFNNYEITAFSQGDIDKAAEDSKNETLWGKPANDIINGRDAAVQYEPVRAIWEMVQNARDVSAGSCKIEFCRKVDSFVFRHNGLPFTNATLNALILQTSSKVRGGMEQVGQYGTGFLTTHLLGRKFHLSGSLQLLENKNCYCNFSEFVVDRTSDEKQIMKDSIKSQFDEKERLTRRTDLRSDSPSDWTVFTYLQPNEKERNNAKECFVKSKSVIPYVMCLNPSIQSISVKDDLEQMSTIYENAGIEIADDTQEPYIVRRTNIRISENNQQRQILSLESKETVTAYNNQKLPKATVIIPIENNRIYSLGNDVAKLFLYLPLVGTETWGVNLVIHSPGFTCATEDRSCLRLVKDGQGDGSAVDTNWEIIGLATKMIFHYVQQHVDEWTDVRFVAPIMFDVNNRNDDLADYYCGLKDIWLKKMYQLPLVEVEGIDTKQSPSDIFVLEQELADAAKDNPSLLKALYNTMCGMKGKNYVPQMDHLIYWSNVFAGWYGAKSCRNICKLGDDITTFLSGDKLAVSEEDQLAFCQYLKEAHKEEYFDRNVLLTEEGWLTNKADAWVPDFECQELRACLKVLMTNKTSKFLASKFATLVKVPTFSFKEIKESIPSVIDELNKRIEPVWKNVQAGCDVGNGNSQMLNEEERNALMDYCRLIIPTTSTAFEAKALELVAKYHEHKLNYLQDAVVLRADLEWRGCLRLLINDALLRFTLLDNEEKHHYADWVKNLVATVYGYSDFRSLLKNFKCYRSQVGEYHYCDKLKKDEGIPEAMKDIYNKIRVTEEVQNVEDVRATLFDVDYAPIADTEANLDALALGNLIMDEIYKSGTYLDSIDTYLHKDLVVEIIENLDDTEEGEIWAKSFGKINNDLGALLMKLVLKAESREPMIQIMKVKDVNKIKKVAEIVQDEHLLEIWKLGQKVWIQQMNEVADFDMKMKLGKYVEDYLRQELTEELAEMDLSVEVNDEQGGQDIVIKKNGEPVYFIEVKSRWITADSVMMSARQLERSVEEQNRYALFAVDMTQYNQEDVRLHRYPNSVEEMVKRIKVVPSIGRLNKEIIPTKRDAEEEVHIGGDYKAIVPQNLIKREGISYNDFLEKILVHVVKG